MGNTRAHEKAAQVVADDLKALIRRLLVRHPVERASFDEFFASEGLHNSRFSSSMSSEASASGVTGNEGETTENGTGMAIVVGEGIKKNRDGVPIAHRAAPAVPSRPTAGEAERPQDAEMSARAHARAERERNREARTKNVSDNRNIDPATEVQVGAPNLLLGHAAPSPTQVQQEGTSSYDEARLERAAEQNIIPQDLLDPRAKIPPSR